MPRTGARPAIAAKRNEAPVACPAWIYANRNRVEQLWRRLKGPGHCPGPRRRRPLRENRLLLPGHPLPRCHPRLVQELTGPSSNKTVGVTA